MYKVKLNSDGSLERHKARLVIRGNHQKPGIDFNETFSPVIKMSTIRSIIALAASRKWDLFQLDINNAFLHGDFHEEVFMKVPDGIPNLENKVCKLQKSLYGLRQASRQWFSKLSTLLLQLGYTQSKNDYSLFIERSGQDITLAAEYVDDILLTSSCQSEIISLKQRLHSAFGIKDLGHLHYFLGFEVGYLPTGISLTQTKFTKELLENSGFNLQKTTSTPLPINCKLMADLGDLLPDPSPYRVLIGKLNFLSHTRSDLAYAVQTLSQFMQSPHVPHLQALEHVLKYIKGTMGQGILLQGSDQLSLQAFSDSDWASCPTTRRSVTGYLVLLGKSPISWKSKKQSKYSF